MMTSALSHLFELAKDKSFVSDDLPGFYLEKGILMRSWRDRVAYSFRN